MGNRYKRILVKLSGEALLGSTEFGIDPLVLKRIASEILEIRHHSLYAPRDFDISPYFAVVKPTIECGFNYKKLHWADLPLPPDDEVAGEAIEEPSATLVPDVRPVTVPVPVLARV